jgi:hypothetical protein
MNRMTNLHDSIGIKGAARVFSRRFLENLLHLMTAAMGRDERCLFILTGQNDKAAMNSSDSSRPCFRSAL